MAPKNSKVSVAVYSKNNSNDLAGKNLFFASLSWHAVNHRSYDLSRLNYSHASIKGLFFGEIDFRMHELSTLQKK